MSTDTLTRQMHESRARRLIAAETRAAAAEAIRKDLEERLVDAEARASGPRAGGRARQLAVRLVDGGGPMTVTVTPGVGAMSGGSVWTALGIVAFVVLGYALALWLGGRQ